MPVYYTAKRNAVSMKAKFGASQINRKGAVILSAVNIAAAEPARLRQIPQQPRHIFLRECRGANLTIKAACCYTKIYIGCLSRRFAQSGGDARTAAGCSAMGRLPL
jgi:hypothetical protein